MTGREARSRSKLLIGPGPLLEGEAGTCPKATVLKPDSANSGSTSNLNIPFVTLFIFVIWMYQVRLLIALLLGLNASFSSMHEFITVVLTTNEGLLFLAIGNAVGAALSLILFSLTVVSFPLLLDRDVDFVTAMVTSVRAVVMSPVPMIGWAAIIVVLLIVSALPYFLGLLVTLPVLGHATWHLYRRIVAPVS